MIIDIAIFIWNLNNQIRQ